ncbi:MAG: hypothetical protein CL459_00820 [Acidimicrobiaceae bacterium]|nr:hypothetical protein [Acidimicrobiaceae bacterium]MBQ90097.1 hypothetical protein [Acidimicrobiaceae bacterium]|tara:strand:+ start:1204 stop:2070 length:867 start_codon:yes stop_codon:yes gene_type:complete
MEFKRCDDLDEALDSLSELGDAAQVLAGGTDVMIQLNLGEIAAETLVHIERVAGIGSISEGPEFAIGSLATHRELAQSASVRERYRSIAYAASLVGGWQTQAVGTIGGNVCNASPAADLLPPLLIHNATVQLASKERGKRDLPLSEFVVGRRTTTREPDELLTGFTLDQPRERTADVYKKVGRRGAMEVAIVGVAVRLSMDQDGIIDDARIAVCSVAPTPFRSHVAEQVLQGTQGGNEEVAAAATLVLEQADPIDDARATARYRTMVLPRILQSAVAECRAHALGNPA